MSADAPSPRPVATLARPPLYRRGRAVLLPVVMVACFTLPHLDQGDFRKDSSRYAAVGLQMWRTGDLLSPYLHPEDPYFNKPPLTLWVHGLALHVGGVDVGVSRLPSVLAALGVVALTVLLALQVGTRAEAYTAGFVLATTVEFFRRTREISMDMWQLLFLLAGSVCVLYAIRRERPAAILLAGVGVGLALLCKPLVGFLGFVIWGVWLGQSGRLRWLGWLGGALAIAVVVGGSWHAFMLVEHGEAFLGHYFGYEVLDRAMGKRSTNGPLYYPIELARAYWPWMIAVAIGLWMHWKRSRRRPRFSVVSIAITWTVVWFIVLTLFPDKKTNYALPLYPGLALIAGWALIRITHPVWRFPRLWLREGCPHLAKVVVIAAVVVALLPITFQSPPDPKWDALFTWLEQQEIGAEQVYSRFGSAEDGRFYLRTGAWPRPDRWIRRGDYQSGERRHMTQYVVSNAGAEAMYPGPIVYENRGIVVRQLDTSQLTPRRD